MSDTYELSPFGLESLRKAFENDEHFLGIALPRIQLIMAIKKELDASNSLIWKVKYSPVNRAENCITVSLPDERKKFHFYYAIPLSLRLNVHLYLGDNTFNFFEAHPLLIQQGIIAENEYPVDATVNTLPHLVLSSRSDRFETSLLMATDYASEELRKSTLYRLLSEAFTTFNQPLSSIINGTYRL